MVYASNYEGLAMLLENCQSQKDHVSNFNKTVKHRIRLFSMLPNHEVWQTKFKYSGCTCLLSECLNANILTQMYLTLDVYKPAGVIAGKRKQFEASEQGGKHIIATWSQTA